ncbi:sugar phosphate isomerase/epimerase [Candidatus Woesearchaeota archaeon]|nr:sugar phosphate isomerase/epimerase [Candidatus Woesearchaeota archaeon]
MAGEYHSVMDKEFAPNIQEIGASTNPFQHQTEALKARIFHGANKVEFSFFGQGKTNKEQPGPETFGSREREDMKAMAEFNKVQTSTHATVGINGLSGFNFQNNSFSSEQQQQSLDELKKAIDFASEASTGGAVVFHTGEGPRSMWSTFNKEFQLHDKEEKEEVHYLVDKDDKRIIGAVKEDAYIFEPQQKIGKDGDKEWVTKTDGTCEIDELTGGKIPVYEQTKQGDIDVKKITFKEWRQREEEKMGKSGLNPHTFDNRKKITKDFFKEQQEAQIQYQLGQSRIYIDHYKKGLKQREKLKEALEHYKKMKGAMSDEDWKNKHTMWDPETRSFEGLTLPDYTDPIKHLENKIKDNVREIGYGREIALGGIRAAKEAYEKVKNAEFIEEFALEQASNQMAEAAVYAHEKTKQRIAKGDTSLEKNPLFISPEGWRPEDFGSHPEELRKLINNARKKTSDTLVKQKGYSETKAEKVAEQSIKATIDIGHMNTWRKFFVKKSGESDEAYHKRFDNWLIRETDKLAKEGLIGHVHLSDNYGYNDEHLAIGDGNAPIKDFMAVMRKNGVDDFIVEAGSFNPMSALPDAWEHLGSPVYRVGTPTAGTPGDSWGYFHQGYFGGTEGPRFVVGDYSPSDDYKGSPFYTGTPLE